MKFSEIGKQGLVIYENGEYFYVPEVVWQHQPNPALKPDVSAIVVQADNALIVNLDRISATDFSMDDEPPPDDQT